MNDDDDKLRKMWCIIFWGYGSLGHLIYFSRYVRVKRVKHWFRLCFFNAVCLSVICFLGSNDMVFGDLLCCSVFVILANDNTMVMHVLLCSMFFLVIITQWLYMSCGVQCLFFM